MPSVSWQRTAAVLLALMVVAALQAWPLPLALSTRLTGPPTGDTGVYVWNVWVFRHQLVDERASPIETTAILPFDDPADLSLHNYTVFSNLLALPLQAWLPVVAAFNLVYLANVTLAGFGVYLLARRLSGRTVESAIGGAVFACSPYLVARSTAHFSLVAAAPLPFFALFLLRGWETRRLRDAMAAGAALAWAAYSDPYYAVYCVLFSAAFLASRTCSVTFERRPARRRRVAGRVLSGAIVALLALILAVSIAGGGQIDLGPLRVSMRSLYTPVLALTLLILARAALATRLRPALQPLPPASWTIRAALAGTAIAALLLAPELVALGQRAMEGRMVSAPIHWRSSPPGVDLVSLLAPNPHHALAPERFVRWLAARPNGFVDQVASLSWVGIGLMVFAWRRAGFRPPALWLGMAAGFALLSLGPFVQIAGLNTHVPTPWALLRYVPLIGAARMPSRLAALATLAFCVLLALALAAIATRFATRRRAMLTAAAAALALELLPVPRTLHVAEMPTIYDTIRNDPRPVRVLELPTGVRDGLSSLGDYSASAQFHQTHHEKGIIGGYLSRVSELTKDRYRAIPGLDALIALSAGEPLPPERASAARAGAAAFLERANIGYVVIQTERISPALRAFAVEALRLQPRGSDGARELYVPGK